MKTEIKWKESSDHKMEGKHFLVRVHGWDEFRRWNVYVYIYPGHPLFLMAKEGAQNCPVPLGGLSYFKKHIDDKGKISSYEWGNDYDWNRYTEYENRDKKYEAFEDAEYVYGILLEQELNRA